MPVSTRQKVETTRYFAMMPSQREATYFAQTRLNAPAAMGRVYLSKIEPRLLITDLGADEVEAMRESGARIYEDIEFAPFSRRRSPTESSLGADKVGDEKVEAAGLEMGLKEVLEHINAPLAWKRARGRGVTIAVIDTGVCGGLGEFPSWKRSRLNIDSAYSGNHWNDSNGHGSMCAAIATANSSQKGRFDGVAPDATLLSARSTLVSTDIYEIYDSLIAAQDSGKIRGPLVISNSYGLYACSPPAALPEDHPYTGIVLAAIGKSIPVVFAAGNNHHDILCQHAPQACGPNSIWAVNSHDRVLSVGTVNRDETNQDSRSPHCNSSRGPGQWATRFSKPDCVAPTYGEVVWGCGYRNMEWWGASGACSQVAGLAALLLSLDDKLTPSDIGQIIRCSCRDIGAPPECVGSGMIDCAAAVSKV